MKKLSANIFRRRKLTIPICYFCYHKVGTVLLAKVFKQISDLQKWKTKSTLGYQPKVKINADVNSFGHSLLNFDSIKVPFTGFHVIRDPRDIIVSGYLYHLRTNEKWCVNTNTRAESPILFPFVPYSQQHRSEEWKSNYLESLKGKSYQENLRSLSKRDGLLFEMENYGSWTINSMADWDYNRPEILEVKFESIMSNYEATFLNIFQHLGFSGNEIDTFMDIALQHDLGRKSESEVNAISHVSSPKYTKWMDSFEEIHKEVFLQKFGDILIHLGYENDHNW